MRRWYIPLAALVVALGVACGAYALGYWPAEFVQVLASPRMNANDTSNAALPVTSPVRRIRAEARVVPARWAQLSMPLDGTVQQVFVREGETVEAGQLLVRLKNTRQRVLVSQAQAELDRAQAALRLAQAAPQPELIAELEAALAAAQANYNKLADGLLPGAITEAEEALAQAQAEYAYLTQAASPQQLTEATTERNLAQAKLTEAQAEYATVSSRADAATLPEGFALQKATAELNAAQAKVDLLQSGATPAQRAGAAAAVRQAQAKVDALKNALPGELAEAAAAVEQAQAKLDLARAGVRSEEVDVAQADVNVALAGLQEAMVLLSETELRAPFGGTITALNIGAGEQVSAGVPLLQLADTGSWLVETLDLTEMDVVGILPGSEVTVTFDALPNLKLTGQVAHIRPVGENSRSSTVYGESAPDDALTGDVIYKVVIAPDTEDERLMWNMTALVDFGER